MELGDGLKDEAQGGGGVRQGCGVDGWPGGDGAEGRFDDDADVAAGAFDGPEEVFVLGGGTVDHTAGGDHDLCAEEVVTRQAVFSAEPADAALDCGADQSGGREGRADDGLPVSLEVLVGFRFGDARPHGDRLPGGVDLELLELAGRDANPACGGAPPQAVTAADSEIELVGACELDHVGQLLYRRWCVLRCLLGRQYGLRLC